MKKYFVDVLTDSEILENQAQFTKDKELNPVVVETAGYVPLDVRFKQMEQAGIRAQFFASEFTSDELRNVYFGENTEIYPGDDLEEIQEKLMLQEQIKAQILQSKEIQNSDVSGTETPELSSLTLNKTELDSVTEK